MQIFTTLLFVFSVSVVPPLELYDVVGPDEPELIRRGIKRITFYTNDQVSQYHEYDRYGRLIRMSRANSTQEYRYDVAGNLIERIYRASGDHPYFSFERFEYDQLGRLSRIMRSEREDRLDEALNEFYRYDSAGHVTEWWRFENARWDWVRITDSSERKLVTRHAGRYRMNVRTSLYDSDGNVIETLENDSSGALKQRSMILDEPCRRTELDTTFASDMKPDRAQWTIVDTCARRRFGEWRARFDDWDDPDSLLSFKRSEDILDERGRSLDRRVFTLDRYPSWGCGSAPMLKFPVERLRFRRQNTYGERDLLISEHLILYYYEGMIDHEKILRYEYEFYTPEEREGATIR